MNESAGTKVVVGRLYRVQRGRGKGFAAKEPPAPPAPVERPLRVAVMLALAHLIQRAIDRGEVRDRAGVARRLGLTRARVTQILDLALLAPDLQAGVLASEPSARTGAGVHRLRDAARLTAWSEQRRAVAEAPVRRRKRRAF